MVTPGTPTATTREAGEAAPLSRRIRIDTSTARPAISGTDYAQDPPELRAALHRHHFEWRQARQRWEYAGPPAAASEAVTAIRRTLAELDSHAAAPPPGASHADIIAAALQGHSLAFDPATGTGSTAALAQIARELGQRSPATRILYLAPDTGAAPDQFPDRVTCTPLHSLAGQALSGTSYAAKVRNLGAGARTPQQWARILGIPAETPTSAGTADAETMALLAMHAVSQFRDSSDAAPGAQHLPPSAGKYADLAHLAVAYAQAAWDNITAPRNTHLLTGDEPGALVVTRGDLVKIWALTQPQLDADVILADEAQHTTGAARHIIASQHAQVIVAGASGPWLAANAAARSQDPGQRVPAWDAFPAGLPAQGQDREPRPDQAARAEPPATSSPGLEGADGPPDGEDAARPPGTAPAASGQALQDATPAAQSPAGDPEEQTWFHGTWHELEAGSLVTPGHPSSYGQGDDHVYFTSTQRAGGAWAYDSIAAREHLGHDVSGLEPHVYQVRPTGPFTLDPANEDNYDGEYHDHKSRRPLRVIREVPYIYNPHPGAGPDGAVLGQADAPGPAETPTGPPATAAAPDTGDILAGIRATTVTQQIVNLARRSGLRPHLEEGGSRKGAHRVILNGEGRDALFGAIYIGSQTGKILRAVLTHGNNGTERPYTQVADVREVLTAWLRQHSISPGGGVIGQAADQDRKPRSVMPPATPGKWRNWMRHRDELHVAARHLASLATGYAPTHEGPGYTAADTHLGHFLGDVPAARWGSLAGRVAWDMLRDYAGQLAQAGITFEDLPQPPGAHAMEPSERAAARDLVRRGVATIRHDLYQPGQAFVRCDGPGADVIVGILVGQQALAAEVANLPGAARDPDGQAVTVPYQALPGVVTLAGRHGIAITPEVRALAAVAAGQPASGQDSAAAAAAGTAAAPAGAPAAGDAPPRTGSRGNADERPTASTATPLPVQPEPARSGTERVPDPEPVRQPVNGSDVAIALRRMAGSDFASFARSEKPEVHTGSGSSRRPGETDAGASETLFYDSTGIRIRIDTPSQTREGHLTWAQASAWLEPGLTPARQHLLREASRARSMYNVLAQVESIPGTPEHQVLQEAADELGAILGEAQDAIVAAALASNGAGPLPRLPARTASRRAPAGTTDALLPLPGEDGPSDGDSIAAALARIAQFTAVLPAWPARLDKPLSEVRPGDSLRHPSYPRRAFTVTGTPRHRDGATEIPGTADGAALTWVFDHLGDDDPRVWALPPAGLLTGPIPPAAPGAAAPAPAGSQTADMASAPGPGTPAAAPTLLTSPAGGQPANAGEQHTPGRQAEPRPGGGMPADVLAREAEQLRSWNAAAYARAGIGPAGDLEPVPLPDEGAAGGDAAAADQPATRSSPPAQPVMDTGKGQTIVSEQHEDAGPGNGQESPPFPAGQSSAWAQAGQILAADLAADTPAADGAPPGQTPSWLQQALSSRIRALNETSGPLQPTGADGRRTPEAAEPETGPAPGPAGSAGAHASQAAVTASGGGAFAGRAPEAPASDPRRPAITITSTAPNRRPITADGAPAGYLSWAGDVLWLHDKDGTQIASLYPDGKTSGTRTSEYTYRACRVGDDREVARRASLEDAVAAVLADAADTGLHAVIDEATRRHEQGLPPRDAQESVVYAWLTAADATEPGTVNGWREEVARQLSALRRSRLPALPAAEDAAAASAAAPPAAALPAPDGQPSSAGPADAAPDGRLAQLEARVAELEQALARIREDGSQTGPTPAPDRARWQAAVTGTEDLRRARDTAARALPELHHSAAWRRTGDLVRSARKLASDARRGLLRFADPARALRAWSSVWARACEITGDLAAGLMNRLRRGSRPWTAARSLRHAAAEGVAHARGWLPRSEHLPPGSYEPPGGYRARTWAAADAATRLRDAGAGPLSQLDFPGALAGVPARRAPGRGDMRRAARTAVNGARHGTAPPAPARR